MMGNDTTTIQSLQAEIKRLNNSLKLLEEKQLLFRQRELDTLQMKENFQLLIENQSDLIVKIDKEGHFQFVSQNYCLLFGKSEAELLGHTFMPLVHEEDRAVTAEKMKELEQPPYSCRIEQRAMTKEGWRWLEWNDSAIINDQGVIEYIIGVGRDIEDKKQAEMHLRESEEKYKSLVNSMQLGLALHEMIFDENGNPMDYRFLEVNPSFERITGLQRDKILNKTILEVMPQTERFWIENYGRVVMTGEPISFENFSAVLKRHYNVFAYKQGPQQFTVIVDEITSRKLAEEKINAQYKLLRLAGEKAKFGGWSVDLLSNKVHWSDEVAAIHEEPAGITPLVNEGIRYYAPEWKDKITEVFTRCANEGEPYDEEMEIITAKGKRIWVRTIGYAVKNDYGRIIKVEGAFQDISKLKNAEKAQQILLSVTKNSLLLKSLSDLLLLIKNELSLLIDTSNFFVALYNQEKDSLRQIIFVDEKDKMVEWKAENSLSGHVVKTRKTLLINKKQIIEILKSKQLEGTIAECWLGVPLLSEGKVVGVMVVQSYSNANAYDETSAKLLEMIAHELSVVIERSELFHQLLAAKQKAESNEVRVLEQKKEIEIYNERLESLLRIAQYPFVSIQQLFDFALEEAIKLTDSKLGYIVDPYQVNFSFWNKGS